MNQVNESLLTLNHQIRETEHALRIARRRRKWSNLSLIFGPTLGIVLYGILWVPQIDRTVLLALYIPSIPIAISFCFASYFLKRYPGGPLEFRNGERTRASEGEIELILARQRDTRKIAVADAEVSTKIRRITYKEDAYSDIDELRDESKRYRTVNNILQGTLIVGSLLATGSSGITVVIPSLRWATAGITLAIGIASGFMGYYKYKERSFYLQQTADSIEQEWEAVEIGVGRYKKFSNEEDALEEFVEEVHRLKSEQKKRQQNLEQPPELRDSNE